ncbi:HEAT repeat domain-containing protein [Streptomyces sp. NPDC047017]|uniref:HEAT repeat domain-containing protein n=1 Tax=Streptomyces sp. NPDC047017 TaxID=3155024 RepID=UPI0033E66075
MAAARRGDARQIRQLLDEGADPDTCDTATGEPVLCIAVAAYHQEAAEALVHAGADVLRRLPDGGTALLRAVDSGSVAMTTCLLPEPVRLTSPVRGELLDRARTWATAGTETELRRRTGSAEQAERVRVEEGSEPCHCEQITLGGLTARDGHAAILTALEAHLRIRTSFGALLARALPYPDRCHAVWCEAVLVLGQRLDEETWAAALDLSTHDDRLHRLFAADVLLSLLIGDVIGGDPFDGRGRELLPWARREPDPEVLAVVLDALGYDMTPENEEVGLSYLTHPEPRVRVQIPDLLTQPRHQVRSHSHAQHQAQSAGWDRPESLAAMLALARDPDPEVRAGVCHWLTQHLVGGPEISEALLDLARDERQMTRIQAVSALALRDDRRCVEAERHIGPVDDDLARDDRLRAVDRYLERGGRQRDR